MKIVCSLKKKRRQLKIIKLPRKKNNYKYFFYLIILLSLFLLTKLFVGENIFIIKQVKCQIEENNCSSENIAYPPYLLETNLFSLNQAELSRHFLFNYPFIQSVKFNKKFPHSLEIFLTRRSPVIQIQNKQTQKYFFVDENEYVIKNAYSSKLATILTEEPINIGEAISSPTIHSAFSIFLTLKNSYIPIIEIDAISISHLKAKIGSGQFVLFSGEKSIENQVDSLQFILKNSTMNSRKLEEIDLRFDNPVVKTSIT